MFNQTIKQVAQGWPNYLATRKVDSSSTMHKLVKEALPDLLRDWSPSPELYTFFGSDGLGNITRAPWFAVFHKDLTDTAQDGYYIVYLISEDLKRLVLEIGFGYTQFKNQYGDNRNMLNAIDLAVAQMRNSCASLIDGNISESLRARVNSEPIQLSRTKGSIHEKYERCGIFSISYPIDTLPKDDSLKADYSEFLRLYTAMADSPLIPDVSDFVEEPLGIPNPPPGDVPINDFNLHPPIERTPRGGNGKSRPPQRRSKDSEKIGRLGEELVFDEEKKRLIKAGRPDLADKVIWHRYHQENRTPGWDITSFSPEGNEVLIEVKASVGSIYSINLTPNEWDQAQLKSGKFVIYLVENLTKNPSITRLSDPAKYVEDGKLRIRCSEFELSLRTQESENVVVDPHV